LHPDKRDARRPSRVPDRHPATIDVPARKPALRQANASQMLDTVCDRDLRRGDLEDLRPIMGIQNILGSTEEVRERLTVDARAEEMHSPRRRDIAHDSFHMSTRTSQRKVHVLSPFLPN
jgi:hypothetical protein